MHSPWQNIEEIEQTIFDDSIITNRKGKLRQMLGVKLFFHFLASMFLVI